MDEVSSPISALVCYCMVGLLSKACSSASSISSRSENLPPCWQKRRGRQQRRNQARDMVIAVSVHSCLLLKTLFSLSPNWMNGGIESLKRRFSSTLIPFLGFHFTGEELRLLVVMNSTHGLWFSGFTPCIRPYFPRLVLASIALRSQPNLHVIPTLIHQ